MKYQNGIALEDKNGSELGAHYPMKRHSRHRGRVEGGRVGF